MKFADLLCRIGLHSWRLVDEGNDRYFWIKVFKCQRCPAEKQTVRNMW